MNRTRTFARTLTLFSLSAAIAALSTAPALAKGGHGGGRVVVSGPAQASATPPMLVPSNEPYYAPPAAPTTYRYPTQAAAPTYPPAYTQPAAPMTYTYPTRAVAPTYQQTGYYGTRPMTAYPQRVTTGLGFRPARMFAPMRIFRPRS